MRKFDCLCCGDCCSGDMEIKLNLYDLYKLSKYLKVNSTSELFSKNLITLEKAQNGVKIPKMVFKKTPYSFCPFLINDLNEKMKLRGFCSLHPYIKPLVCILAPISKVYDGNKKTVTYTFTKPTENCPGKLYGMNTAVEELLDPVKDEIIYENKYFDILDSIIINNIKSYETDLYHFDINNSFHDTLNLISKFFIDNYKEE